MSVFGGLVLTNNGRNLFAKAQTGKLLNFTRIVLGDGQLGSSESIINVSQLKNEVLSCSILNMKIMQNKMAKITFIISNQELEEGFYWRELGIIAEDPDTKEEVLYCYGNARENGEYISAKGEEDILEKHVSIDISISNAENVSAIIDESLVFVDKKELEASQQDLLDDMSKTYTGTNITAPTVEGYGRINKVWGHIIEEGTGEKSPTNPYTLRCVGDDVNLAEEVKMGLVTSNGSIISTTSNFIYTIAKVEPNTTYIISKNKGNRFQVYGTWDYPAPGVEIKETYLVKNEGSLKQITTLSTAKYLFIYLDNSGAIDIKVKIQKGSIATPYSPYNKGTVEIISQNGDEQSSNTVVTKPLCSLQDNEGNIVAQDWIDYSRGVVHRECGYIGSYNNESISTQYISSTGNLTAGATVVYKLATIVEEPIDCSNKIVQYSTQTTVSNRDGAKIEVSLTNNEAIAEVNGEFKNNEIQTITNENGTVIKFPNGMSICSFFGERATGSTYGDVIWNYPMPFKEAPVVLGLAGQGENYAVLQMMLNSPGTNMAVVQFLQNNSYYVSKKAKFSIVAIGRWK